MKELYTAISKEQTIHPKAAYIYTNMADAYKAVTFLHLGQSDHLSLASITAVWIDAEILHQFSESSSVWKLKMRRGVQFHSGSDSPLEIVSGPSYWRTEPVWMDKPAVQSGGVSIVQSDNCTQLNKKQDTKHRYMTKQK